MIAAGDLRERVLLRRPSVCRNDYGEQVTQWPVVYSCRARVQFRKGSRALGEGEMWNPTTVVVTVRYSAALGPGREFWRRVPQLMALGMRLEWMGQAYHIDSLNIDRAAGTATLTCSAVELSGEGLDGANGTNEASGWRGTADLGGADGTNGIIE